MVSEEYLQKVRSFGSYFRPLFWEFELSFTESYNLPWKTKREIMKNLSLDSVLETEGAERSYNSIQKAGKKQHGSEESLMESLTCLLSRTPEKKKRGIRIRKKKSQDAKGVFEHFVLEVRKPQERVNPVLQFIYCQKALEVYMIYST